MNIIIKKQLLIYKGYKLKCSIGKSGLTYKKKEGDLILSKLEPSDFVVILDEKGVTFSSIQFSRYLEIFTPGKIKFGNAF